MSMSSFYQQVGIAAMLLTASAAADDMTTSVGSEFQTLRVSVQAPNPCWTIEIKTVYSTDEELLVVSELMPPAQEQNCIQIVGQVEDEVSLQAPTYRVKHFILGRSWDTRRDSSGWGPEADYVYLRNDEELSRMLKGARPMLQVGEHAKDEDTGAGQQTTLAR